MPLPGAPAGVADGSGRGQLGVASLVIMALHVPIGLRLQSIAGFPPLAAVPIAVFIPYLIAVALRRMGRIPRWLFLGQSLAPESGSRQAIAEPMQARSIPD